MKRSRFSEEREEQIIGILKEHGAGVSVADLCRKYGVSDASIGRGRDAGFPAPPAQIRTCGATAYGSCLGSCVYRGLGCG